MKSTPTTAPGPEVQTEPLFTLRGLRRLAEGRYAKHPHLVKYLGIGLAASAIDVALFLILFNLMGTSALVAHSVSVPASVLFSFVTNARHNFRTRDRYLVRMVSFAVVCTIGYAAGFGVIKAVAGMGFGENAGKLVSLPVVFVIQYLLNSRITFRSARKALNTR